MDAKLKAESLKNKKIIAARKAKLAKDKRLAKLKKTEN